MHDFGCDIFVTLAYTTHFSFKLYGNTLLKYIKSIY